MELFNPPQLKSSISVYNYRNDNLITQVVDPFDDLLQYVNLGEVNANGVEFELNYDDSVMDQVISDIHIKKPKIKMG